MRFHQLKEENSHLPFTCSNCRSGVFGMFIANFQQISNIVLVFPLLDMQK